MNHIPDGYHTVNSYLVVNDLAPMMDFLCAAFAGEVTECINDENGAPNHVEIRIGDSTVMLGQAREEWEPCRSMLYLYVADCDATYRQAMAAGGVSIMEPQDMYYGDRNAAVADPSGNSWWIGQRQQKLTPAELQEAHLKNRA